MFFNIQDEARAYIRGGKDYPQINGVAEFKELSNGVMMTIQVNGLPSSIDQCKGRFFGLHIHEGTSCKGNSDDEFANAKTHFNPTNCEHPYHAGDLPPLIENNGYAYMEVLLDKFKVKDILGKVIIIHDMPDDFTTQPSGNSGTKIACGKII